MTPEEIFKEIERTAELLANGKIKLSEFKKEFREIINYLRYASGEEYVLENDVIDYLEHTDKALRALKSGFLPILYEDDNRTIRIRLNEISAYSVVHYEKSNPKCGEIKMKDGRVITCYEWDIDVLRKIFESDIPMSLIKHKDEYRKSIMENNEYCP